jgi:DnaJ-class molecular chaperone
MGSLSFGFDSKCHECNGKGYFKLKQVCEDHKKADCENCNGIDED